MSARAHKLRELLAKGEVNLSVPGSGEMLHLKSIPDSPCRVACPAGVNVKAYVGLIGKGDFLHALEVVREKNPLPGICGRVCTHPCELECRRGEIDEPLAIRQLKRFIADYALSSKPAVLPATTPQRKEKVAIVGSGPAGLTAANDLRRLGYDVTIFEAQNKPGGMLVWGIPPFRLPRNIIEEEINSILNLGIKLLLNTKIDHPGQLLRDGYAAVFFAPGCQKSIKLGFPKEDEILGVIDSLSFLKKVYNGELTKLKGRVLVIGGGDSAIDSARVARRLGAEEVWIVYRRTKKEMPAAEEEMKEAEIEGVRFEFLTQPVGFLPKGEKISGLRCVRCQLAEPDASGRRKPVPIAGSEFAIDADWIITALGQKAEMEMGNFPQGIFIGGDAAGGAATVINAIASGHEGAKAIHQFITGRSSLQSSVPGPRSEMEIAPGVLTAVRINRTTPKYLPVNSRRGFEEIEAPFSPEQAIEEAKRCLRCGPCDECVRCSNTCPKHQAVLRLMDDKGETTDTVFIRVHGQENIFFEGEKRKEVKIKADDQELKGEIELLMVQIDEELCRACERCIEVCPHEALRLKEWQRGILVASIDHKKCRGCGTCVPVCPSGALKGFAPVASITYVR
ncbi:MAG: FAD-dependent oxidoreductase [candidate division WOR-3 bacterium]